MTMRALVDLAARAERARVRLCAPDRQGGAPAGRDRPGAPATTIHRLLEYVPDEGFARGPEDPIPGTDVLIVDEASMLSVRLADALLRRRRRRARTCCWSATSTSSRPSGPGRVLDDLIESGAVPVVRLTEIFRQAARSLIVRAAHAINAGEPPPTAAGPGDVRDFFLIERARPRRHPRRGRRARRAAPAGPLRPRPARRGARRSRRCTAARLGIDALNAELRARLNADGAADPGHAAARRRSRDPDARTTTSAS